MDQFQSFTVFGLFTWLTDKRKNNSDSVSWQYFSVFVGQVIRFLEHYCSERTAAINKSIYAIWADGSKNRQFFANQLWLSAGRILNRQRFLLRSQCAGYVFVQIQNFSTFKHQRRADEFQMPKLRKCSTLAVILYEHQISNYILIFAFYLSTHVCTD